MKDFVLDTLKGGAATVALFLAYLSLPMIGLAGAALAPFPAIYYALKRGRWTCLAVVAVAAVVLAAVGGPTSVALYLLQCGVVSLALPEFLKRGSGAARSIGATVAIQLVLVAVCAAAFALSRGGDLNAFVVKGIQASIAQTIQLYEKSGLKGEELRAFQSAMASAGELIGRIYPALVIIALATLAGVNLLLVKRLAGKFPGVPQLAEFKSFKNPEPLIWFMIAAGFAMLVRFSMVQQAALNILVLLLPLYFLQGVAVVTHFFDRFAVSRLMRTVFYLFLLVTQFPVVVVTILGIFDLWGNFRAPREQQNL